MDSGGRRWASRSHDAAGRALTTLARVMPDPRDPDSVALLRVEPQHLVLWAGRWYRIAAM
jgi:hypothetical protein